MAADDTAHGMTRQPKRAPMVLRKAIGHLLRLADIELRDARSLLREDSTRNAALLLSAAVSQMTKAVAASECGWPDPGTKAKGGDLAEGHPLRQRLAALAAGSQREPDVLPDGQITAAPDAGVLQDVIDDARKLLTVLSDHFRLTLEGDEPAGAVAPIRPEPMRTATTLPAGAPARSGKQQSPLEPRNTAPDRLCPNQRQRSKADAAPGPPPSSSPQPLPSAAHVSSTVFWSLMDRWGLADPEALALLGHPGGLTQKGTRPRFRLSSAEDEMMAQLQDIDGALDALGLEPRTWLRAPIAAAPFNGADPITFVVRQSASGARELRHYILQQGLRLSLQQG